MAKGTERVSLNVSMQSVVSFSDNGECVKTNVSGRKRLFVAGVLNGVQSSERAVILTRRGGNHESNHVQVEWWHGDSLPAAPC